MKELAKEVSLEGNKDIKDKAPGELIKDVNAENATEPNEKEFVKEGDESEGVAPDELVEGNLEPKVDLLRMTADYQYGLLSRAALGRQRAGRRCC